MIKLKLITICSKSNFSSRHMEMAAVIILFWQKNFRKEYPVIDRINELPSPSVSVQMQDETSPIDADISQLLQDYWGIQFDVLLKDGIVKKLEDFVDHIE